jgi:fibro-slime domain-containing protein
MKVFKVLVLLSALIEESAAPAPPAFFTIIATVRDLRKARTDMQNCITGVQTGMVESTLDIDRKPVLLNGNLACTDASLFVDWYHDTAANDKMEIELNFTETSAGSGIFKKIDTAFFPIDNKLFGNEGFNHNYHFTMEFHSQFTYNSGQIFNFCGDDDVWVFINNKLVVDLGGVHGEACAGIDLDTPTLGLAVGETYNFDFFFAERHRTESNFKASFGDIELDPVCTSDDQCNDNIGCTTNACAPDDPSADQVTGCLFTPVDSDCDDGLICTTDTCNSAVGCVYSDSQAQCATCELCSHDEGLDCSSVCSCGSAYARFPEGIDSTCFSQLGAPGNQWGWSIGPLDWGVDDEFVLELWWGAAYCESSRGLLIGNVTLSLDEGGLVEVLIDLDTDSYPDVFLQKTHVFAGSSQPTTFKPGKFGNTHDDLQGTQITGASSDTFDDLTQELYYIVHASACVNSA